MNTVKVGTPLTPAELRVLNLRADGFSTSEVADLLSLSIYTVQDQLKFVQRRLGADNIAHAVRLAIRTGQMTA